MADLSDSEAQSVLDYLGRSQPIAGPSLALTGGGTGGAVTAPVTAAVPTGTGVQSERVPGQSPMDVNGGPNALGVTQGALSLAQRLGGLIPAKSPTRGDTGGVSLSDVVRGGPGAAAAASTLLTPSPDAAGQGLEIIGSGALPRSAAFPEAPIPMAFDISAPGPAAAGVGAPATGASAPAADVAAPIGSGAEELAAGAPLATGSSAAETAASATSAATTAAETTAAETAAGVGGALRAVGPYVTAASALYGAITSPQDYQKAIHSLDTALALAGIAYPPLAVVAGIIEALDSILGATGIFGGQPSHYDTVRAQAGQQANTDLSNLSGAFQNAAKQFGQSGGTDWASAMAPFGTQTGDVSSIQGRNPVRTGLMIPLDVAKQLGLPVGDAGAFPGQYKSLGGGVNQYGTNIEAPYTNMVTVPWSALTPEQFQQFVGLYGQNPEQFGRYVRGSGDVAYLNQEQAQQVAANAQQEATGYLNFLAQVSSQRAQPPAAAAPTPAEPAPTESRPMGLPGPGGALGFAGSLVGAEVG